MSPPSAARRTERLLNLVIALLSTRRWLSKEQIRSAVPQYADCPTVEAFDRMFERDKEDLRELGVPLVTGEQDLLFGDVPGYRIDRETYPLPPVAFTPAELAVLALASQVWQQASLAGPAARALVKLRALGVPPDDAALVGIEPRVRTGEPAFQPLYEATRDRAAVSFSYRRPRGAWQARHVQPWAITNRRGRWYLAAFDLDRDAPRVFRLDRVRGAVRRTGPAGSYRVPADLDLSRLVGGYVPDLPRRTATVRLRAGSGHLLRRRAEGGVRPGDDGWDVVQVPFADPELLAEELSMSGPDVVALAPADLRAAVVRRLGAVLRALDDAAS